MRIIKNVLVNTRLVAFTGFVATLMLSVVPASAQSTFSESEMSSCMATLIGETLGSRINLRSSPGISSQSNGFGLVGDRVHLLRRFRGTRRDLAIITDRQGFSWYEVGFPKSGARGWIRHDFISPECPD